MCFSIEAFRSEQVFACHMMGSDIFRPVSSSLELRAVCTLSHVCKISSVNRARYPGDMHVFVFFSHRTLLAIY